MTIFFHHIYIQNNCLDMYFVFEVYYQFFFFIMKFSDTICDNNLKVRSSKKNQFAVKKRSF